MNTIVPITPTFPNLIGNLDAQTIAFETRFVRNVIDSDVTLPSGFAATYDGTTTTLNGRSLTITGLQYGDAIQFAAGSGFVLSGANATLNGSPIATMTGNTNTFTLTFTSDVTSKQLEALLESLTFQAGSANPASTTRTLSYTVNTPTPLTGSVGLTLSAPLDQNRILDLDNQNVLITDTQVRLDSAITLSDEFKAAYSTTDSLSGSALAIDGWSGQTAPISFASGSGITTLTLFGSSQLIYVDENLVDSLNLSTGRIDFGSLATAATVERLIEAIVIDPQFLDTTTRTITVTVTTPTLPQRGTVTLTGAEVALSDLSDTLNVTFSDASYGVKLDTDVTLRGDGPWSGGTAAGTSMLRVTGLADGDLVTLNAKEGSGIFYDPESSIIRDANYLIIGQVSRDASGLSIKLQNSISPAQIEKIIESLELITQTSGSRVIQIAVTDASGDVSKDTITVNVGYIPTLTDMAETVNLTAAQAAAGQVLDADVTFRVDSDMQYGGIKISGLLDGDVIELQTGNGSPISLAPIPASFASYIFIGDRHVGTFTLDPVNGPAISMTQDMTAADIEAILENLIFRTTSTDATREITIKISDTDGETDTQVITVNILVEGANKLSYEILQDVDGKLLPIEGGTGTAGDLDPTDLFGSANAPDAFVVRYSGVLDVGKSAAGEQSVFTFDHVLPGTLLIIDGTSYELDSPEGRLALDLAPGLHRITIQVPGTGTNGQVTSASPTITYGTATPPGPNEAWPDFTQTPIWDDVRTAPATLYRVDVTTEIANEINDGVDIREVSHVFYVTSLDDIQSQLDLLLAHIGVPDTATSSQSFTTTAEVTGGTGADILRGTDGNDLMDGGAGDDLLLGSLGSDTLDGGTGVNGASYERSNAAVTVDLLAGTGTGGHAEGDVLRNIHILTGSRFGDELRGTDGADSLYGGPGDDTLIGNSGDDLLEGGIGNDSMTGGAGSDLLRGFSGADTLLGGEGDDTLSGGLGADSLDGGAGSNLASYVNSDAGVSVNLQTGTGTGGHAEGDVLLNIREVMGSSHGDVLTGSTRSDVLRGENGDDILNGARGVDRLVGGAGDDSLFGGEGHDRLMGGIGADSIDGGRGIDTVSYAGSRSGVTIDLSKGTGEGDNLSDATGDVIVNVERVVGSGFVDVLIGSNNADTLDGGAGADLLSGGAGNDVLIGGAGADAFIFDTGFGEDQIIDFGIEDSIAIMPSLWGDVSFGDIDGFLDAYGVQGDGYVELRLTETDILRIDDITLTELSARPEYFILGG